MTIDFYAKHSSGHHVKSPLQAFTFPDGAAHIKGVDDPTTYVYQIAYVTGFSHDDLFTLAMWADACQHRNEKKVLILPYLPGARMDRGTPLGADVYAVFLGAMVNPDQTITIDPHSEGALRFFENTLQNVTVFPVNRIIRREVQDGQTDNHPDIYAGVIAPDKGAHDRAAAAARDMGVRVYTGGKTRDFETGKITGFHMEDELPETGKFLIVDDICDGGGTFNALAEATGLGRDRLDLWVTHGIFSKGFKELRRNFGVIHTTDSFYSVDHNGMVSGTSFPDDPDLVKVHKLTPYLYGEIDL